jgi:hypothetical protein
MSDSMFPPPPLPGVNRESAKAALKGPAIGLAATAIIGGLFNLVTVGVNILGVSMSGLSGMGGSSDDQVLAFMSGTLGLVFGVIALIVAGVVLYGALQMMEARKWGLALTVSILAMIPCISPCCIIGIPIGIWAIIVLNKPEVRGAFTA